MSAGTIEAVWNGSFDLGLVGWDKARDVSQWPVLQSDGSNSYVSLHPSKSFRGPLLYQNMNVTGVAGATVTVSLRLPWMYSFMNCGQSNAVYLDYLTSAGESKSVKLINPRDCSIPYGMERLSADYAVPSDATKLTRISLVRVGEWGPVFADDVSVQVPDTATIGMVPEITGISSTSGTYGSTLTISGFRFGPNSSGQGRVTIGGNNAGTITSWSHHQIQVTVGAPAATGRVEVIADGVSSAGSFDYAVESPHYTIRTSWAPVDVVRGQTATLPIAVDASDGYTTSAGIGFSVSGGVPAPASFAPASVTGRGSTLLTLDSSALPEGEHEWIVTAQEPEAPAISRSVRLAVHEVGEIKLYGYDALGDWAELTSLDVVQQGPFSLYVIYKGADGEDIEGYVYTSAVTWTSNDPSKVLALYTAHGGWVFYANENGPVNLTATSPDGHSVVLPVNVNFPTSPMFTSLTVSPSSVTNSGSESVTLTAEGVGLSGSFGITFPGSMIGGPSGGDQRYEGSGSVGEFHDPGTYACVVSDAWNKPMRATELTVTNDPTTGVIKGALVGLPAPDGSCVDYSAGQIRLYDQATGTQVMEEWVYAGSGAGKPATFTLAAVPPGTYLVMAQPSNSFVAPHFREEQWFANAYSRETAQIITVAAGQTVEGVNLSYTSPPLANPAVLTTRPANGATDVAINQRITVTFDQPIARDPFEYPNPPFVFEDSDHNSVSGVFTYANNDTIVTFTPDAPLAGNRGYTAKLAIGVQSSQGLHLMQDYEWSFTTGTRTLEPPLVVSVYPAADATSVPTNSMIAVVFDQPMDPQSFSLSTFSVLDAFGNTANGNFSFEGNAVMFESYGFYSSSNYTVTIAGSVCSADGMAMGADYTWSFSTGYESQPPHVIFTVPADGATGVPIGTQVKAVFDQRMDASTINDQTFDVRDADGNLAVGTVLVEGFRATFTPDSPLEEGTTYTARLTTDVRSEYWQCLDAEYSWSFATSGQHGGGPSVVKVYPTDGSQGVSQNTYCLAILDRDVDPTSVDPGKLTLVDSGGSPVPGVVECDGPVVRFVPDPSWLGSYSTYTATISGAVRTADGGVLGADRSWSFTTGNWVTPPVVVYTMPVADATDVPIDASVKVVFDQAMEALTINEQSLGLYDANYNQVAATVVTEGLGATLTPESPLWEGITYTAWVTTDAMNRFGLRMQADYLWSFATSGQQGGGPAVTMVYPAHGSEGVSLSTYCMAIFDRDVDPASIDFSKLTVADSSGNPVDGAVECDGHVVRFVPDGWLHSDTTYIATISGEVRDMDGLMLGLDRSWVFTTGDWAMPPIVVYVEPANGSVDVPRRSRIKAYFDQPMSNWSIHQYSFYLEDVGLNWVSADVSGSASTATLESYEPLMPEMTYTATVTGSVYSEAGYYMNDNHSWSFTTGIGRPIVVSTQPYAGQADAELSSAIYATFDQLLDPASLDNSTFILRDSGNNEVSGGVYCWDHTAEFYVSESLQPLSTYTATLTTGVRAANGLTMEQDYTWSFTTNSGAPRVSGTTPSGGTTGWWAARSVEAQFTIGMDMSSLNSSTFRLEDAGGNPVSGHVTANYFSAQFVPDPPLNGSTTYTATVTTGAKSEAGMPMEADYSWSFTTAANSSNRIGDLRGLPDGTHVALASKGLYYAKDSTSYVEEADRSAGIRYQGTNLMSYTGRQVDVSGTLGTDANGERFLQAYWTWIYSDLPIAPLGATNRSVKTRLMDGLRVRVWGEVKSITDDYTIVISDGSDGDGLIVKSEAQPILALVGDRVAIAGAAGWENGRVIRAQQIDFLDVWPNVGTWFSTDGSVVIAFLDSSRYVLIEDSPADQWGWPGMEMGTYFWDRETGAFSAVPDVDTNGEWGFSDPSGQSTLTISGNDLTFVSQGGDGEHHATRVLADPSNPLVGGWWMESDKALIVMLADGQFFTAVDGDGDGSGQPGIEHGTYAWDPPTKVFATPQIPTDTNGDWGLSGSPTGSPATATVSGQTLTFVDAEGTYNAQHVGP